jgi:hypothetical protein
VMPILAVLVTQQIVVLAYFRYRVACRGLT